MNWPFFERPIFYGLYLGSDFFGNLRILTNLLRSILNRMFMGEIYSILDALVWRLSLGWIKPQGQKVTKGCWFQEDLGSPLWKKIAKIKIRLRVGKRIYIIVTLTKIMVSANIYGVCVLKSITVDLKVV